MRNPIRVILTILTVLFMPSLAQAQTDSTPAKQAIIVDYETGTVLFEKNADEHMPTSSMSKTMTMYMVFEALKSGRLTLDTMLPVSEKAWRMGGSKMFVELGKSVPVEALIQGVVVQSGNDATIVLAEGLSGTEEAFADTMNAKAKELGMMNSHFVNASGWPDPEHYSTARDLATLAQRIIADFPDFYPYFAELEFTWSNIRQGNRNPLLYKNIGADGLKTGHTEGGGYGLIGSGVYKGRRVIMVLNGMPDDKTRALESARLLEWAMKGFENVKLFKAGDTVETAEVVMGVAPSVPLVIERSVAVTLPATMRNDLKVTVSYDGPLMAPVQAGQQIGTLHVEAPRIAPFDVPLVTGASVEKLGFFAGLMAKANLKRKQNVAGE